MADDRAILETSRRLSEALSPGDLDSTLGRITAAAVDVLPDVAYASITVRRVRDGRLETVEPTDDEILRLDKTQYELREGPCYEAATDSVHVTAPDLARDPRFPAYGPVAESMGVRAQAAMRLFDADGSSGALNLYATRPGVFADLDAVGALFRHQAAVALAYARQVTQLQEAIETRQLIGQAVGVTMERFDLDEARAFAFLTRLSQDQNVKVNVLARRLVEETLTRSSERTEA